MGLLLTTSMTYTADFFLLFSSFSSSPPGEESFPPPQVEAASWEKTICEESFLNELASYFFLKYRRLP